MFRYNTGLCDASKLRRKQGSQVGLVSSDLFERLPNRMASIPRWSRQTAGGTCFGWSSSLGPTWGCWIGADLGQPSRPIIFGGRRSAVGGRRATVGGRRRSAVGGGRLTGGGPRSCNSRRISGKAVIASHAQGSCFSWVPHCLPPASARSMSCKAWCNANLTVWNMSSCSSLSMC